MKKVPIITEKPWSVPRDLERLFNKAHVEQGLKAVNLAVGNDCYVRDSYKQKLIIDSDSSLILCGYPKRVAEKEGFNFYQRILPEDSWKWLVQMNLAGYEVFFKYPRQQRFNLVSSYKLVVETVNKGSFVLHHRTAPYQLCKNGNLWLSVSCVSQSTQEELGHATVTNTATGEVYNFIDGAFVLSSEPTLTRDEVMILEWMANEVSIQQMSYMMKISTSSVRRKRDSLLKKLDAKSDSGAIHRAHLLNIL